MPSDLIPLLRRSGGQPEQLAHVRAEIGRRVGGRIRLARGLTPRAELAALMCVHENTIGKMERGESLPDAAQLLHLAQIFDCSVSWFLSTAHEEQPSSVRLSVEAVQRGDWIFVPVFNVSGAAVAIDLDADSQVQAMQPFDLDFVRDDLRIEHGRIALVRTVGDGMEPQIHSGDMVLIDREDRAVQIDGPHLVRIDGALSVKSLQRRPGGLLRVTSLNPGYEPFDVQASAPGQFEVVGRVRWAGVRFR